jgi:Domain of unknown function (DUF4143)
MIRRQKTIDQLRYKLDNADIQCIALVWEKWIGKSTLLRELESDGFFGEEWLYTYIYLEVWWALDPELLKQSMLIIIDTEDSRDIAFWKNIISMLPLGHRLIFTCDTIFELESTDHVILGWISFREYADSQWYPIEIGKVLSWESDIDRLNDLKETYMERGWFPLHLTHPETILDDFNRKRTNIESYVFNKEHEALIEYMRALAMGVGTLFKADQLAKLLDISRRKVNKYTQILIEQGIIKAVWPWWPNSITETSRHVKIYFTDLSFLKMILGDNYNQGTLKNWAIENFIYLELERKLDETHRISYYRKKSWAEITFILENIETDTVTPVEVTLRGSETVSQVFRTFDDDYHDKVERYMLINASIWWKKDINGTSLIILPHVAI